MAGLHFRRPRGQTHLADSRVIGSTAHSGGDGRDCTPRDPTVVGHHSASPHSRPLRADPWGRRVVTAPIERGTTRPRRARRPADEAQIEGRLVLRIADEDREVVAETLATLLLVVAERDGLIAPADASQ